MDEARETLNAILAVLPNHTVATGRPGVPFGDEAVFQHYMDGLRLAGCWKHKPNRREMNL